MWTIEFSPEINRLKTHQFKQKTMPQTRPDLDKSNGKVVRFLLGFF